MGKYRAVEMNFKAIGINLNNCFGFESFDQAMD